MTPTTPLCEDNSVACPINRALLQPFCMISIHHRERVAVVTFPVERYSIRVPASPVLLSSAFAHHDVTSTVVTCMQSRSSVPNSSISYAIHVFIVLKTEVNLDIIRYGE